MKKLIVLLMGLLLSFSAVAGPKELAACVAPLKWEPSTAEAERSFRVWQRYYKASEGGKNLEFKTQDPSVVSIVLGLLKSRAVELRAGDGQVFEGPLQSLIIRGQALLRAGVPYLQMHSFLWEATWYISGDVFPNFSGPGWVKNPMRVRNNIFRSVSEHKKMVAEAAQRGHFFEIALNPASQSDYINTFHLPLSRVEFRATLEEGDHSNASVENPNAMSVFRRDFSYAVHQQATSGTAPVYRDHQLKDFAISQKIQEKIIFYGLDYFIALQHQKVLQFLEAYQDKPALMQRMGNILNSLVRLNHVFDLKGAAKHYALSGHSVPLTLDPNAGDEFFLNSFQKHVREALMAIANGLPERFIPIIDDVVITLKKMQSNPSLPVTDVVITNTLVPGTLYIVEANVAGVKKSYTVTMTERGIEGILSMNHDGGQIRIGGGPVE